MPQRREAALLGSALAPRSGTLRAQVPCLAQLASAHDAPAGAAPPHRLSSAQRRLGALLCNHKGFGVTDWCWRERIANVATSAPFFVLGARLACAPVAPPAARAYGASLLGVGVAALAYHTSAGTSRPHWRQLDYLSIGGASWCLLRALAPQPALPPFASLLSAALVPLHPLAAAAAHATACEAVFLARAASGSAQLRRAHRLHIATSFAAGALFVGEEIWPEAPLVHAAWHCAAAASLAGFGAVIPGLAGAKC